MPKQTKTNKEPQRKLPPARTPEAQENRMISLSMDLAEKQLLDGSASSQIITHFLKLASTKEQIEKDILKQQKELITAKTEQIKSHKKIQELYAEALSAMRKYSGSLDEEEPVISDDD